MPIQYLHLFIHAFKHLEQRVIWKYEEDVPGVSENVLVRRWLPQQDILGGYYNLDTVFSCTTSVGTTWTISLGIQP